MIEPESHPAPRPGVRAILFDDTSRVVLIKRTRPGIPPYWTLPGGGIEHDDPTPEDALRRELREELGVEANIGRQLVRYEDGERSESIRLATLIARDPADRTGAEFDDLSRGAYEPEHIDRTHLPHIDLRPEPIARRLLRDWDALAAEARRVTADHTATSAMTVDE